MFWLLNAATGCCEWVKNQSTARQRTGMCALDSGE